METELSPPLPGCNPQGWQGPRFNTKTVFPRYGDSHVIDKTVVRPHGDPYTGKTSLYQDDPQDSTRCISDNFCFE